MSGINTFGEQWSLRRRENRIRNLNPEERLFRMKSTMKAIFEMQQLLLQLSKKMNKLKSTKRMKHTAYYNAVTRNMDIKIDELHEIMLSFT